MRQDGLNGCAVGLLVVVLIYAVIAALVIAADMRGWFS